MDCFENFDAVLMFCARKTLPRENLVVFLPVDFISSLLYTIYVYLSGRVGQVEASLLSSGVNPDRKLHQSRMEVKNF